MHLPFTTMKNTHIDHHHHHHHRHSRLAGQVHRGVAPGWPWQTASFQHPISSTSERHRPRWGFGAAVITAHCRVQDARGAGETVSGTQTLLLFCRLATMAKQTFVDTHNWVCKKTHTRQIQIRLEIKRRLQYLTESTGSVAGYKRSHLGASTTVQIRQKSANCAKLYRNGSTVH